MRLERVKSVGGFKTKLPILCTTESYISKAVKSSFMFQLRDSRVKSAFFIYVANNILGISFKKRITAFRVKLS